MWSASSHKNAWSLSICLAIVARQQRRAAISGNVVKKDHILVTSNTRIGPRNYISYNAYVKEVPAHFKHITCGTQASHNNRNFHSVVQLNVSLAGIFSALFPCRWLLVVIQNEASVLSRSCVLQRGCNGREILPWNERAEAEQQWWTDCGVQDS